MAYMKTSIPSKNLEKEFEQFAGLKFHERGGKLRLSESWGGFPVDTDREEILRWFDVNHHKGISDLLVKHKERGTNEN